MVDRYSLISVKITNFRKFKDVEIDFTNEGVARRAMTIFGAQGSGKSSIILAIQWCAYGTSSHSDINNELHSQSIPPSSWGGERKEDISVLLRLRPEGADALPENDIQCERILSSESSKDHIQVSTGGTTFDETRSREEFNQIFGIKPKIEEGVMWIVREKEMTRMSETITDKSASYFLDFMNLRVPRNGLTELNAANQKEITKITNSSHTFSANDRRDVLVKLAKSNRIHDDLVKESEELLIQIHLLKPNDNDDLMARSGQALSEALNTKKLARSELMRYKIKAIEIPNLLHSLLAAKLKKSNIEIDKSYDGSKYDWTDIADYLGDMQIFGEGVIEQIRELSNEIGIDTSKLLQGEKNIHTWQERIISLKQCMAAFYSAQANVSQFERNGITIEKTKGAEVKNKRYNALVAEYEKINTNIELRKEEIDDTRKTLNEIEGELWTEEKNDLKLKKLTSKGRIIRALIEVINQTDAEYKRKMFNKTIERVKSYWKKMDCQKIFEPILIEGPQSRFALKNLETGAIHNLESTPGTGVASNGESELLLVCTCLAVAESSGAKMPVILDDCFTKVDPDTREKMVTTVTKEFGSLIFLTNDLDKAKLHSSTEGILELDPQVTIIDSSNQNKWLQWRDNFE
jgi:hypothetical protein